MNLFFYFLFLLVFPLLLHAEVITSGTEASGCVYSEKELNLFEQLSKRHLELLKKEAELNTREKALNEREELLQGAQPSFTSKTNSTVRIYMQLPPAKAVELLNSETPEKAAEILLQMPSAFSGRLIDKMETSRSEIILKKMAEIEEP